MSGRERRVQTKKRNFPAVLDVFRVPVCGEDPIRVVFPRLFCLAPGADVSHVVWYFPCLVIYTRVSLDEMLSLRAVVCVGPLVQDSR